MKVYHLKSDFFPTLETGKLSFPDQYVLAAEVKAETLEQAFEVTNHITHDWRENEEVVSTTGLSRRSTSVGDVVVDNDGQPWLCEMADWTKLAKEPEACT